jgi:glutamate formiminotransferase/formiminotetrahydrofolate cyclodeaminase
MARLVECVPNFSEGRDRARVDRLAAAAEGVEGVVLLDVELDPDHHRSVVTFAGEPEPVVEAAFRAAALAVREIDLRAHRGQHPRMGAVDVVPFVPIEGVTLDECVELARRLGRRLGEELELPVFLYEAAATRPERANLAEVRRGEFEGLALRIGSDAARDPDFGPRRIHPTAGAVAVGARKPLVAFNANLATADVQVAKAIARAIRHQSGGLRYVKALGFSVRGGRQAQVSMNLVDTEGTPMHRVLALIDHEACRYGTHVTGCEVVGLVPEAALLECAEHALRLEGFRRDQVLEIRLRRPPLGGSLALGALLDRVAEGSPTPGGGSLSALAGALAAALAQMVANLTLGRSRYAASGEAMRAVRGEAQAAREELISLLRRDSEAFEAVLAARRLPAAGPDEERARQAAVEAATLGAARVPLRTAELAVAVARLARRAAEEGNPNAVTDAGTAAWLARAAGQGALLNVEINLQGLPESADKRSVQDAAAGARRDLETEANAALAQVSSHMALTP